MSLLTQASLVLTPNAYKSSKLYSIIPSSGNGDLTTTRTTTATRVNSSGVIENVATGIPRLDYSNSLTSPAWLLEPQRTNRVLNSATVVTQTITTTAVANTLSFYGTGTITLSGTFSGILVGTGASNRVSLTFTPTAGNLILTVSGSCANGQIEIGSYATSYIPTIASSVTRNVDIISRNNIYTNGLITSAGGTWFIELNNNFSLTRDLATNFGIGDTNTLSNTNFSLRSFGTGRLTIVKFIAATQFTLYTTLTDTVKIAIKWNGLTADVYVNGTKVVSATSFTTTVMEYLKYDAFDVSRYIKSTMLFSTPLTDAEMASLTTL